jgi:hypothetical protein
MRRLASALLYGAGGLALASEGAVPFLGDEYRSDRAEVVAVLGPFVLIPLGVASWVSPGHRLREFGLVLLVAAGFVALSMGILAYCMIVPGTQHHFPLETSAIFSGYRFGLANPATVAAAGWLMLYNSRPRV